MDIGKITQLAKTELGEHAKCVYHQDYTGPEGQNHLKVDDIAAGDVIFVDTNVTGSHPQHSFQRDGLLLSVERPVPTGNIGSWAAANVQNIQLPAPFLLVAVFERPTQTPLNPQHVVGTYAPNFLMNAGGTLTGPTSQIRTDSVRLNVVPLGLNRPFIDAELRDKMVDTQHPSDFALALKVDRTVAPAVGRAWLFVGNTNADFVAFDFPALDASTPIIDLRAGMGTANGVHYRAAVSLLRFQIWTRVS